MKTIVLLTSVKCGGVKRLSKERLCVGEDISNEEAVYLIDNGAAMFSVSDGDEDDSLHVKSLEEMNQKELQALCASKGLKGFERLKKAHLIELLEKEDEAIDLDALDEDALRKLAKEEEIDISECPDMEAIRECIADHLGV